MSYFSGRQTFTPTGSIVAFSGLVIPSGYLIADGSNILRSTFASLFATIGTRYGAGDGVTTFGIPDLRGVFLRGLDAANVRGLDSNARVLGDFEAASTINNGVRDNNPNIGNIEIINSDGAPSVVSSSGTIAAVAPAVFIGIGSTVRPHNVSVLYLIKT